MQKENNCFIAKNVNMGVFNDDRKYQACCCGVFFDKIEHIANISFTIVFIDETQQKLVL